MNYTSIEQSKHLLELGLKPETADMKFVFDFRNNRYIENPRITVNPNWYSKFNKNIPCWSTDALLNLMPPYLFEWDGGIDLQIYPHLTKKKGWLVSYIPNNIISMQKDKFRQICHADTLVEAAYNMVVWLLQNNYIKTE